MQEFADRRSGNRGGFLFLGLALLGIGVGGCPAGGERGGATAMKEHGVTIGIHDGACTFSDDETRSRRTTAYRSEHIVFRNTTDQRRTVRFISGPFERPIVEIPPGGKAKLTIPTDAPPCPGPGGVPDTCHHNYQVDDCDTVGALPTGEIIIPPPRRP
jgi:hypothetical protein